MTLNQPLTTSERDLFSSSGLWHSDGALPSSEASPHPEPSAPDLQGNRDFAWKVAPNLLISFKYAWAGLRYAFVTQRNFRLHTVIGTLAISLGIYLQRTAIEMAIIGLTIALVMTLELLNTALESVVDLTVKQSYHELAKIAKDCAAGAVLISAIAAIFVASLILLPPLSAAIASNLN
ncbi:MAG: diacylglycerol kinase family protein [Cyanobacteriota bacterium]|nr:diacylglycerol kinase family protein [Cyanobacteriota bacterium]